MKDGNVMMQNSSGAAKELAKKINKALMGNANRVSQWVKYCCCLYAQFNFLRFIHKKKYGIAYVKIVQHWNNYTHIFLPSSFNFFFILFLALMPCFLKLLHLNIFIIIYLYSAFFCFKLLEIIFLTEKNIIVDLSLTRCLNEVIRHNRFNSVDSLLLIVL